MRVSSLNDSHRWHLETYGDDGAIAPASSRATPCGSEDQTGDSCEYKCSSEPVDAEGPGEGSASVSGLDSHGTRGLHPEEDGREAEHADNWVDEEAVDAQQAVLATPE